MSEQKTIKFIIAQDGSVYEEVTGTKGGECLNLTRPFEEALGTLQTRSLKPEYYNNVTLQQSQDKTHQAETFTSGTDADGLPS